MAEVTNVCAGPVRRRRRAGDARALRAARAHGVEVELLQAYSGLRIAITPEHGFAIFRGRRVDPAHPRSSQG